MDEKAQYDIDSTQIEELEIGSDDWYEEMYKLPDRLNTSLKFEEQYPFEGRCDAVLEILEEASQNNLLKHDKRANASITPGYVLYRLFVNYLIDPYFSKEKFRLKYKDICSDDIYNRVFESFMSISGQFDQYPYLDHYLNDYLKDIHFAPYIQALNSQAGLISYAGYLKEKNDREMKADGSKTAGIQYTSVRLGPSNTSTLPTNLRDARRGEH